MLITNQAWSGARRATRAAIAVSKGSSVVSTVDTCSRMAAAMVSTVRSHRASSSSSRLVKLL